MQNLIRYACQTIRVSLPKAAVFVCYLRFEMAASRDLTIRKGPLQRQHILLLLAVCLDICQY